MNEATRVSQPDFQGLPDVTYRQLEVFREVCREGSYANAAHELRSTRANVKRVCTDFENAVGRRLFDVGPDKSLVPSVFANGLLNHVAPLARALRRLDECVRSMHDDGRILRFAADGEFFKGGMFTDYLARLQITDRFRPCFLRIETKRFRTALLNAECDVYFGAGLHGADRLDIVPLGRIPWDIHLGAKYQGKPPQSPADLPNGKWWIASAGELPAAEAMIKEFQKAGAKGGRVLDERGFSEQGDGVLLTPDMTAAHAGSDNWPCFQFTAVLRKHHPYSELLPRLAGAAAR